MRKFSGNVDQLLMCKNSSNINWSDLQSFAIYGSIQKPEQSSLVDQTMSVREYVGLYYDQPIRNPTWVLRYSLP